MTTITIYGVGLMGGSLALCFRGKPDLRVVGHSHSEASVKKYKERGVVDYATTSFEEAAAEADFIFVCVPVGMVEDYLNRLSKLPLKPGCVITDVGSTKASICRAADAMDWGSSYFIGGHPMAGSERSGVEAATPLLYENAFYVLTPGKHVPESVYESLVDLLRYTRAQIVRVEASQHDDIVGAISHLPHIIAVALVNQVAKYNESDPLYQNLAAGGFRDITRIAASEPVIWRDILLNNREVVLRLLSEWKGQMESFTALLESGSGEGIEEQFRQSREFRNQIPERRKGVLTSLFDLYVDVPDHPGIIGEITTSLGNERINLSNIQIIENRADVPGILRLSFRNEEDMDRAAKLLKPDYHVHA
ncbi:prephenate dehydrogenase [Paenibacillus sp. CC-CFT747]|nr:prephenate dehydrogenase [Paenibacillus sp. CC-CFT747]